MSMLQCGSGYTQRFHFAGKSAAPLLKLQSAQVRMWIFQILSNTICILIAALWSGSGTVFGLAVAYKVESPPIVSMTDCIILHVKLCCQTDLIARESVDILERPD